MALAIGSLEKYKEYNKLYLVFSDYQLIKPLFSVLIFVNFLRSLHEVFSMCVCEKSV